MRKKLPKAPPPEEDELTDEEVEDIEEETEGEEVEEESPRATKKKLVRRPVEEEDEEVEEEEEELPRAKKKLVKRAVVDEDEAEEEGEEDEEVLPKKRAGLGSKKGKSALAKAFDSVPLSSSAEDLPAGKYEAIVREAVVQAFKEEQGQSIRFKYEICTPKYAGQQITQWFKIVDGNEEPVDWMIDMLKKSLGKLGIEIRGDDLEDTIQEIHDEHPGIILKVAYAKGNDGNIYPRPQIQGECNNDVVEAYRDSIPF